jgi:hypothetical protein
VILIFTFNQNSIGSDQAAPMDPRRGNEEGIRKRSLWHIEVFTLIRTSQKKEAVQNEQPLKLITQL